MKFGRYFRLRIASRMRLRVCSGMEREAAELFQTAETVPGVRPRCSATAFSVTWPFFCLPLLLLLVSIFGQALRIDSLFRRSCAGQSISFLSRLDGGSLLKSRD